MIGTYIFTDQKCTKVLDVQEFKGHSITDEESGSGTPASQALFHRSKLVRKLKTNVVAWSLMGGDNEIPKI